MTTASMTVDQATVLSVGDFVLLHPWHLMDEYDGNVYAKVTKVNQEHFFVRTRAVVGPNGYPATALSIPFGPQQPRKVPNAEVNGTQVGKNMFKPVVFQHEEEFLHGQVVDYQHRPTTLLVRTRLGDVMTTLPAVMEVPPPIAFLFFSQLWKTENWSQRSLIEAHQAVLDRIQGFEYGQPIEEILALAFDGIGPVPTEPTHWINLGDGNRDLCRPVHAALFVRSEVDWQAAPSAIVSQLGNQWCADPVFKAEDECRPDATEQPTGDVEPPSTHPVIAEVTQSPVVYAPSSRPKRVVKDLFPQPPAGQSAVPVALAEDALSIRGEEEDHADWDEELSQASEAVIRCLEEGGLKDPPKQSIRSLLGLTDASFQDTGRRAKKLHHPTTINNIMSRAFHSDECNRMDAQSLLESFVGARLPWNVHPFMSIRLRNAQFGLMGVRGFMFKKVEERERRAWALQHAEHLSDYGENCKVFDLPPLQSKQELVEAYTNLVYYFNRFGSTLAKSFGTHLQWFVSNLQASDMPTLESVGAYMDFIDSVLANFARAVNTDVRNGTALHELVHLELTKTNPELLKELDYLRDDRMRLLEASLNKKRSSTAESAPASKKPKKTSSSQATTRQVPRDSSVMHLVARHGGKQICLRHLSVAGCYSKDPAKCYVDERVHHVPTEPLPAAVVKHMTEKWSGLAPKYSHLAA
jgi:hypothetical protein